MARFEREQSEYIEKVVATNRVSKTVKGGRVMKFSALMVVGDGKGKVGYGLGKAAEVAEAIRKGIEDAKKHMVTITLSDNTIPHEVIVRELPEDEESMEAWLTEKLASAHGAKVRFTAPQKGEKAALVDMAETNAKHTLMRYKVRTNYEDKRVNDALLQLESALALDAPPMRIECFDISTIHGSYTVASMVVFTGGKPDKNQYRRFKIKTPLDEANDFLSMQEVMSRRYCAERMADERFGSKPDLIILDGGKPQLSAVMEMFDQMGIDDIALCGLAKRDEELFVPWQDTGPVVLPSGSASLYLVKQVRDEAHRFLPPRAPRQGHDGKHLGRGCGLGSCSQESPAQAFQILQEPQGSELGGDQGGPCGARRGRRGASQGDRAV